MSDFQGKNFDEDADLEILAAWEKEKEGDSFRDTQEWLVSWDYFKAGWLAAKASSTPSNTESSENEDEYIDWEEVPLNSCPNCGGKAHRHEYMRFDSAEMIRIKCEKCGKSTREYFYCEIEVAVIDWNSSREKPGNPSKNSLKS